MDSPEGFLSRLIRPFRFSKSSLSYNKKIETEKQNIIEELSDVLENTSDNLNSDEKILKGVIDLSTTTVNTIMCHRIDVTAIDYESSFAEVIDIVNESGFSRIPVYSESFDNIKGILYAKDIIPYIGKSEEFRWQDILRTPYFVPETKRINILLKELQVKKVHMAIVIDEYGGTSGIVTLEDILEEIVGEIEDESDEDETLYKQIDSNNYIFLGKIMFDEFLEILHLDEEEFESHRGESETLAGFILERIGEMPTVGQTITFNNLQFKIESIDYRRITKIRVTL